MSKRSKPSTRAPRTFALTPHERMFLMLYRCCPEDARVAAGRLMFETWRNVSPAYRAEQQKRYERASRALYLGGLSVSLFDDITGGAL